MKKQVNKGKGKETMVERSKKQETKEINTSIYKVMEQTDEGNKHNKSMSSWVFTSSQ
jgi:hypothetical protein